MFNWLFFKHKLKHLLLRAVGKRDRTKLGSLKHLARYRFKVEATNPRLSEQPWADGIQTFRTDLRQRYFETLNTLQPLSWDNGSQTFRTAVSQWHSDFQNRLGATEIRLSEQTWSNGNQNCGATLRHQNLDFQSSLEKTSSVNKNRWDYTTSFYVKKWVNRNNTPGWNITYKIPTRWPRLGWARLLNARAPCQFGVLVKALVFSRVGWGIKSLWRHFLVQGVSFLLYTVRRRT